MKKWLINTSCKFQNSSSIQWLINTNFNIYKRSTKFFYYYFYLYIPLNKYKIIVLCQNLLVFFSTSRVLVQQIFLLYCISFRCHEILMHGFLVFWLICLFIFFEIKLINLFVHMHMYNYLPKLLRKLLHI